MNFGLKTETINAIRQILGHYNRIEEVIIYGSRAKGDYRDSSDIDLTLKGKDLSLSDISKLTHEIDDLLLPCKIDISIFHKINNPDLIDHIKRVGIVFYKRNIFG